MVIVVLSLVTKTGGVSCEGPRPHIFLPIGYSLYGCETWSLTLREEHRLGVFKNTVLGIIFGAKRDEVTGEWRKLHNEEINDLYSSPSIIRIMKARRMRWAVM
jgi:hypothetical protein